MGGTVRPQRPIELPIVGSTWRPATLKAEPEGFHVLHLSCHARPGELILETDDGREDPVSARRLLDEALPAGVDLPMVVLSGCSTGLGLRDARSADPAEAGRTGERALGGVAEQMLRAGVPVVMAMQAPVSDTYATALAGGLYEYLASAEVPDGLGALSEARRGVERTRQQLPLDAPRRGRAEWATPALWVRGLRLPLFNRHEPFGPVVAVSTPVLAEGIVVRQVGEFVGRRQELRVARRALRSTKAGLVIHGIGGVGKSTLAAEIISTADAQYGVVVSLRGALSVDQVLDELGARLTTLLPAGRPQTEQLRSAAQQLRHHDVEWADRWRRVAEVILPAVPMIVLFDNFEDNLHHDADGWTLRDPELGELLARWARRAGQSTLLFTSRHPFALPEGAQRRLERLHLGPLSAAETAKVIWQLPGLDALSEQERLRAYRDVGGHPRTLEYLDALLQGGHARFDDVAERMEQRLSERGIPDPAAWMASGGRDLDGTLAEAITLAIDDVVLGDLLDTVARTPLAHELVVGASVYRVPVDVTALVWQLADETDPPDLERDERVARVQTAIQAVLETADPPEGLTAADLGLTNEEVYAYQADMQALRRPPVTAPEGFGQALAAARATGLIAGVTRADDTVLHLVHRWTARAIAQLEPQTVAQAHHRAARYWRWRVERIHQSQSRDLAQLIEARYHHHAAGEHDAALDISDHVILKLQTWGQYGHAAELCRESLAWVPGDSARAAAYIDQLGLLAHLRGDYDTAEQRYIQALEMKERLGDQAGLANSYGELGILAQARGDYETAEQRYIQSLELQERLGDQAGLATSYHQLGILAQLRGDYETAEQRYTQSLEMKERLGNQAGLANSCATLATLMSERGDDEQAIGYDLRALAIRLHMSDRQATFSVQRLTRARSRLGSAAFTRIVAQFVDEASLKNLSELLDSYEQHDADPQTRAANTS
ncbi:MAG TPA: tetratricopeptide repeat protein [Solirubrobacteraceae bacterium]|nr:tetratricopeptide repeat protein [Solirubrobacteraceae bacterium]